MKLRENSFAKIPMKFIDVYFVEFDFACFNMQIKIQVVEPLLQIFLFKFYSDYPSDCVIDLSSF